MDILELMIPSLMDGTLQPSLFYFAGGTEPKPLVVGLHTWSYDRFNQVENMLPWAKKLGWNLLLPEFRGPNMRSNAHCGQAMGAKEAIQDVLDATEYVCTHYPLDRKALFLVGGSGGGHMALMTAAHSPALWRAVASFVPVCDVYTWYQQNEPLHRRYADDILACCGCEPDAPDFQERCFHRSPVSLVPELAKVNLKIFTGKFDKSIDPYQTLSLFHGIWQADPQARVFLDFFDGGHDIVLPLAEQWFLSQLHVTSFAQLTG